MARRAKNEGSGGGQVLSSVPESVAEQLDMALEVVGHMHTAHCTLLKLAGRLADGVRGLRGESPGEFEAYLEVVEGARGGRIVRMVFGVAPLVFNVWFRACRWVPWTLHAEAEERDLWREYVSRAVRGLAGVEWLPFRRAAVHFTFTRKRETSCDAFLHCVRHILDGLVEQGILKSDSGTMVWFTCRTKVGECDTVEVVVEEEAEEGAGS